MKTKCIYIISAKYVGQSEAKPVILHLNVNRKTCCVTGTPPFAMADSCLGGDFSFLLVFWMSGLNKEKIKPQVDGKN